MKMPPVRDVKLTLEYESEKEYHTITGIVQGELNIEEDYRTTKNVTFNATFLPDEKGIQYTVTTKPKMRVHHSINVTIPGKFSDKNITKALKAIGTIPDNAIIDTHPNAKMITVKWEEYK